VYRVVRFSLIGCILTLVSAPLLDMSDGLFAESTRSNASAITGLAKFDICCC
jgi:hypothetical protein